MNKILDELRSKHFQMQDDLKLMWDKGYGNRIREVKKTLGELQVKINEATLFETDVSRYIY